MVRRGLPCSVVVMMLLVAGAAAGHEEHRGRMTPAEIEIRAGAGELTLPFQLVNNHVIIPISIGGARFRAILDTGMPMDGLMLYGTEAVGNLGLEYGATKARIGGAGGEGRTLEADLATGVTVEAGPVRLKNMTVLVPPPIPHFTTYHDGVIGASLFNNFAVEIDYDERRIHLHDPATYSPPKGATELPLSFKHNAPFVEAAVIQEDGRERPVKVVVDLGASHAISLNTDGAEAITVPADTIRTVIGRGVGGPVRGEVGRIPGLKIGGIALADVVATFPISEHQNPGGMNSGDGNLGDGVLKRFNVTFDYARKRMVLLPNRTFGAPFEWDMSGLRLEPTEDAALRIESILAGSPAEKAGLAKDDIVTRVNGRAVSAKEMFEILEMMKKDGAVLEIEATRAGEPIAVTLALARMI